MEGRRTLTWLMLQYLAIHSGVVLSIMAGIHFSLSIPTAFTEYCFMDHPINQSLFENETITFQMKKSHLNLMGWV